MTIDLAALEQLAQVSPSRKWLATNGYHNLCGHTDLQKWGYQIRRWANLVTVDEYYEYLPLVKQDWKTREGSTSGLPRVCLNRYADQTKLHFALGISIVQPGQVWEYMPLFAGMEV